VVRLQRETEWQDSAARAKKILTNQNNTNMSALEPKIPTKLEIWLNRIVTIALAAWSAVQYLLSHWSAQ
jgi:hypothetical protein